MIGYIVETFVFRFFDYILSNFDGRIFPLNLGKLRYFDTLDQFTKRASSMRKSSSVLLDKFSPIFHHNRLSLGNLRLDRNSRLLTIRLRYPIGKLTGIVNYSRNLSSSIYQINYSPAVFDKQCLVVFQIPIEEILQKQQYQLNYRQNSLHTSFLQIHNSTYHQFRREPVTKYLSSDQCNLMKRDQFLYHPIVFPHSTHKALHADEYPWNPSLHWILIK